MVKKILVEPHVDAIVMPENLRVGLMVFEQRKKCRAKGCNFDYYGFGFGQSPFHVPTPIVNALKKNADKGHYTSAEGITDLREAAAGFNKRHFKLNIDPSRIIIGPGTKQLIHMIFDVIKGDVIIPSPSWIGYYPQIKLLDKYYHTFYLKPEDRYKIQPDDLDDYISKLHKEQHILVVNNPHNPTGAVYTKKELKKIADVCSKRNVLVLADEIYALMTYKFENFVSMGKVYPEGTFVTNGLSKDRSAAGYRLGACILPEISPQKLKDDFKKVAATIYTNVCTPVQHSAITAYKPNKEIERYFRITRNIHRIVGQYMSRQINKIDGVNASMPEGGFYFFADFNEISKDLRRKDVKDSNSLGDSLLSHPNHIAAVTGDSCMLKPNNYGARIAFVDYDGKKVFEKYKHEKPKTKSAEEEFVKKNTPRIYNAINAFRNYVKFIRKR